VASGSATTKFTDKFNSLFDKFSSQTAPSLGLKTAAKNVPSPKFYANVCQNHALGKEYSDYENSEVMFGPQDDFEFTMKLGRGRYSEVFRGVDLLQNKDVVIKILKPVKKIKVRREIKILQTLRGGPFVIDLYDTVADPSTRTPSLVFEYVENMDFRTLWSLLTLEDIQTYIL
jgi:casein kinase II subunit alpha